jgi:hypothetical protein
MPYDIKDKLARRGFWFIFETPEQPLAKDRYTFTASVFVRGQTKPLLTLDSTDSTHEFWYKTLSGAAVDAAYVRVPAKTGLDAKSLPCLVIFHADLPADLDVIPTASAIDWNEAVSTTRRLNTGLSGVVAEARALFAGAKSTSKKPLLLDVPLMPPVPTVDIKVKEPDKRIEPGEAADVEVQVVDWSAVPPRVTVNDRAWDGKPVANAREFGYGKDDEPLPTVISFERAVPIESGRPRIEVRADNGTCQGAAIAGFTAEGEKKRSPMRPNAPMYGLAGFRFAPAAGRPGASEALVQLPYPPRVRKYLVELRLTGEPVITSTDRAPADKRTVRIGATPFLVDLYPQPKPTLKKAVALPSSDPSGGKTTGKLYVWNVEYRSAPLLFIDRPRHAAHRPVAAAGRRIQVFSVGDLVAASFKGLSPNSLAGHLGVRAVAMAAGFVESTVSVAKAVAGGRNGRDLTLECHVWGAQKLTPLPRAGHRSGLTLAYPKPMEIAHGMGRTSIRFDPGLPPGRYVSEALYIRKYGCELLHPVRLWKAKDSPTKDTYPRPNIEIRPSVLAHVSYNAEVSPETGAPEYDAWYFCYAVYMIGHEWGYRLEHPSPDDVLVLFEGWPGAIPWFEYKGLSQPIRANYCPTRGKTFNKHGIEAFHAAWRRYKNDWMRDAADRIQRRVQRGQRTILQNAWHPYCPMLAMDELKEVLADDADVESVSVGGYSIGTNRALYLAQRIGVPGPDEEEFLGGRPICVNHLVLVDFNFGACNFLPFTTILRVPSRVRHVHHVFSAGRMRPSSQLHYGPHGHRAGQQRRLQALPVRPFPPGARAPDAALRHRAHGQPLVRLEQTQLRAQDSPAGTPGPDEGVPQREP